MPTDFNRLIRPSTTPSITTKDSTPQKRYTTAKPVNTMASSAPNSVSHTSSTTTTQKMSAVHQVLMSSGIAVITTFTSSAPASLNRADAILTSSLPSKDRAAQSEGTTQPLADIATSTIQVGCPELVIQRYLCI